MEQRRVFSNGEVVIKTDEGVFFHAHSENAMPISIDKEDGEKLFNLADEEETTKQKWGVFYPHPYKRELVQECDSFEDACEQRMNWSFNNEGDPDYFVDEVTEDDRDTRMPLRNPVKDNVKLLGGQMEFPHLTPPQNKEYDIKKAQLWVHMINDGKRPTKWLTPNKKGTKVNFDFVSSVEARETALHEVKMYLEDLNSIHGLDMKLK